MNHCLTTPIASIRQAFDVNSFGTFLISREAAKIMAKQRVGRIINIVSVAVPLALAGEAAYVASKAAVVALTSVLASELAPLGITVNAVGPGPMHTDMTRGLSRGQIDEVLNRLAQPSYSTIEDVINVLDFYMSKSSSAITCQTIYLS